MRKTLLFLLSCIFCLLFVGVKNVSVLADASCAGTAITFPNTTKHLLPLSTTAGRSGNCITPKIIVVHVTQGPEGQTLNDIYDYFATGSVDTRTGKAYNTSSTFVMDTTGKVEQLVEMYDSVSEETIAVHAYNDQQISIEMISPKTFSSKSEVPAAQYSALLSLIQNLMTQYSIPIGDKGAEWISQTTGRNDELIPTDEKNDAVTPGVYGHYQLNPNSRADPGKGLQKDIVADLQKFAPGVTPGEDVNTNFACAVVKVGEPQDPAPSCAVTPDSTAGNFVYYCQGSTDWQNTCNLGSQGCGPTSMAMIFSTFGVQTDPAQMAQLYSENGLFQAGCSGDAGSTSPDVVMNWVGKQGFTVGPSLASSGALRAEEVKRHLDEGYLLLGSSATYPCKWGNCAPGHDTVSHIFVVDSIDLTTQTVRIRDPFNCEYSVAGNKERIDPNHPYNEINWYYAYPIKKN